MDTINKNIEVVTFGCRLNASESEVIRSVALRAGASNTVIVNTCAVTAEAERQARQAIRRIGRRLRPGENIVVTGCAAQINPGQFVSMPEVSRVFDNNAKLLLESYVSSGKKDDPVKNSDSLISNNPDNFLSNHRSRAYVQIQNGCDHRCTFCIIPFGRGPSRSLSIKDIVSETTRFLQEGFSEIVLTGVDITAWGNDFSHELKLGNLVKQLLCEVPELSRLRLTSIDPAEIDDDLWDLLASEQRLLPHIHFSAQSGDNIILKRMKRRHSREQMILAAKQAKKVRPDITLGADLIVGFPTETETAFENTLALVDECDLSFLHVFPFSERTGTPAARMPQVPVEIRRNRAAILREKGQKAINAHLRAKIGSSSNVLIEKSSNGSSFGRSDDYSPVVLESEKPSGMVCPVVFTGVESGRVIARLQHEY